MSMSICILKISRQGEETVCLFSSSLSHLTSAMLFRLSMTFVHCRDQYESTHFSSGVRDNQSEIGSYDDR